jgi:predicted nucleotidyltransferase
MRHPPLSILKTIFEKYPEVQAVYLFGSIATGRANAGSDLDLAVLADIKKLLDGRNIGSPRNRFKIKNSV